MEKIQFMLDLETLSSEQVPVVVQIGCVAFNIETSDYIDAFSRAIDFDSQIRKGGHVSYSTVNWWLKQPKSAQKAVFEADKVDMANALMDLNRYFRAFSDDPHIWSHAAFDAAIMNAWYSKYNIEPAYSYRNTYDLRTIRLLFDPQGAIAKAQPDTEVKHDAVNDCLWQIAWLTTCLQKGRTFKWEKNLKRPTERVLSV